MIKFFIFIFLHFRVHTIRLSYSSCQISIHCKHQKSFYFNIYFREFTSAINQPCSKAWLRMGESDVKGSKKTIITISIENCTKNYFKVFVAFRVIFNIHPSLSDGSSPTPSGRFSFSNSVHFST